MNKESFKKKYDALSEEYVYWAEIRNNAMCKLQQIIKKCHKLEDKYFKEHPEELED